MRRTEYKRIKASKRQRFKQAKLLSFQVFSSGGRSAFGGQLAKTEDKLILGIPLVARIRPIVVQPQAVLVAFEFENVRVAVAVGFVRCAIRATARLIRLLVERPGCILFGSMTPQVQHTKLFLFCWRTCISSAKSRSAAVAKGHFGE